MGLFERFVLDTTTFILRKKFGKSKRKLAKCGIKMHGFIAGMQYYLNSDAICSALAV